MKGRNSYRIYSDAEINAIFDQYGNIFNQVNERLAAPAGLVRNLIIASYKNGIPNYPYLKQETRNCLSLIFDILRTDSDYSQAKKKAVADLISDAFIECQAVQSSTIFSMAQEILAKEVDLISSIRFYWQNYKMQKLKDLIHDRHPKCEDDETKKSAIAANQFPHIKSAYLCLLGEDLGLDETERKMAADDKTRPSQVLKQNENQNNLKDTYISLLKLDEFAKEIALDINSSNIECSLIDKELVQKWGAKNDKAGFGYYDPNGEYGTPKVYTEGIGILNQVHKDYGAPFISLEEVNLLLNVCGISK